MTGSPTPDSGIRLLASDLDGTLLRSDNTVSEATRQALAAAERAGLIIAFVTGRPPRWLHEVAAATGHTGVAIGANGAVTYDLHTETVLIEHQLVPELLDQVTGQLRAAIPQVRFGMEYGQDFAYEPGYRHDWELAPAADGSGRPLPSVRSAPLSELLGKPVIKLLAKGRNLHPDQFMDEVEVLVGDVVTVTRSGHSPLVEISPLGVTKASGLAELAASFGVRRDQVAAIGDMPNDVPMLTWAGQSYAVANAHSAARQAASSVLAESNDEDAVAKLIWRLLGR
ncbi:MAG TPA: HAD family hydrolase [Jatrophihabitans sp.]|nr:HAD family hydrolase [Jatrophihabitans sp.]